MELKIRNYGHKGKVFYYEPSIMVFKGKILPNPEWVASDCITMATDNPDFPFRIIRKADIIGSPKLPKPKPTGRTYKVKSSKGDQVYIVTDDGQFWSCTCVGFQYHQDCKHIRQIKDRSKKT